MGKGKYPIVNSEVRKISGDSIVYLINGQISDGQKIDKMTKAELEEWKKTIKSVTIEFNKKAIDSLLINRFKAMVIIQLKDETK